jgi:hypothetical protein
MTDVVVTIPQRLWDSWLSEGDLPGDEPQYASHFWIPRPPPVMAAGERVYVVAHGALRGYAPLFRVERYCSLSPGRACLLRIGGAVAVSIPQPITGFRGWRYRWWDRADEVPFPAWREPRARVTPANDRQPGLFEVTA